MCESNSTSFGYCFSTGSNCSYFRSCTSILFGTIIYIYSKFIQLVKKNHTAKRGRTADQWTKCTAKYPIHRNHTIDNLRTAFTVYMANLANQQLPKGQRLTMWKLGEKLRIAKADGVSQKVMDERTEIERRNILAASVSRYIKQAQVIIDGTAEGRFPA